MAKRYWLFKSEPSTYSIDDLEREGETCWEGIRNYQVRNMLRDEIKPGDEVLFYHSSCPEPGAVGIAKVTKPAYPDESQFDPNSKYYDPKSDPKDPRWVMVDVAFVRRFPRVVSLSEMREEPGLEGMPLLRRGNRLSITPVGRDEWRMIGAMAKRRAKS